MEPRTRNKVEVERQRHGCYGGSPQRGVALEQLRVVHLVVGRAAGRMLLLGRPPLIAAGSAGGPFPVTARCRAAVIALAGTWALREPRRNVSTRDGLAEAHTRRHEQRPTRQEENQRSDQAMTHRTSTPIAGTSHFTLQSAFGRVNSTEKAACHARTRWACSTRRRQV